MESVLTAVHLSEIDGERFGIRIARAPRMRLSDLVNVMGFCQDNDVDLLICRCPATDLQVIQAMERQGSILTDTLVYFVRDLGSSIPTTNGTFRVRSIVPGEEDAVRAVAAAAFHAYCGHYHADPRLDRALCDEAYSSWAFRSCTSRDVADEVRVALKDGTLVGFATLRMNQPGEGEGVLFGILPSAQGNGVYRGLILDAMQWCVAQGATRMVVSTQITNIAVQKVWTRVGFEPSGCYHTLHKWFK